MLFWCDPSSLLEGLGGGGREGMREQEGGGREGRKREGGSLVSRLISSYCAREEMRFFCEKEPGYEARTNTLLDDELE